MHERPLSPHLQVYRLPLTALLSITHRVTGVVLLAGLIGLAVCLMNAAQGAQAYAPVQRFLQGPAGGGLVWIWVVALLFHFCHGIRHLIWDTGFGFRKEALGRQAALELAATAALAGAVYFLS
jgi:succinate dehydrogenase / fumarate reductase cytochrome b subunit